MNIVEPNWKWASPLVTRNSPVNFIVVHHAAGDSSAEDVHYNHIHENHWSGIGYHYYIELNGQIHRGRPERMMGAHVNKHNHEALGVCFSGNYETRKVMPKAQLDAGKALLADLQRRYPQAKVRRHKDMPDNATACPGKYFPFDEIVNGGKVSDGPKMVDKKLLPVLKQEMLRYAVQHDIEIDDCLGISVVDSDGTPSTDWGEQAKRLAWRVSDKLGIKQGTQPTQQLFNRLK